MDGEVRQPEAQASQASESSAQAGNWGQAAADWYGNWSGGWLNSAWNGSWGSGSYSGYWKPYQWQWGNEDSRSDWQKTGTSESGSGGSKPEPPEEESREDAARRASTSTVGEGSGETATDSWTAYERRASMEDENGNAAGRLPKVGKDNIPEFDGSGTMREYQRRVRLFEISTSIDPSYRAQKLMEKLSGTAWLATESIPLESLKHPQGVERLLKHLWAELEPLEFLRVFSTLADFYKGFRRAKGQEFVAYDMAFRMHLQRLEEINAGLEGVTKAYWFLEKAGLSAELRKQVVAAAGGAYDYPKLRAAVMAIVPQVSREEESSSTPNNARMWKRGTPKQVHATMEGEEGEDNDELAPEDGDTAQLEAELEVLMTHAAKKRAAIEQSRGFRAPESSEAREKRIKDMKARMPCSACKAHGHTVYGHWHSDPACPYRGKTPGTAGKPEVSKGSGTKVLAVVEEDLSDSEYEPDEEGVFMATLGEEAGEENWCANAMVDKAGTMEDMKCMALSDTCCARSVAGEEWAKLHMKHLHALGADAFIVPEKRPFRFGAGPRVYSSYSMVIPLAVDQAKTVPWIRVSVVPQQVPLLLSKSALKSLGTVMDLAGGRLELSALGTETKLVETATGLCGFMVNQSVPRGDNAFPEEGILTQDHEVEVGSRQNSNRQDQSGAAHPCQTDPGRQDSNRQDQSGAAHPRETDQGRQDSNRQDQSGAAHPCHLGQSDPNLAGCVDPERLASALRLQQDFSFESLHRLVEAIPLNSTRKHRDSQGGRGRRIQGMIAGVWTHGAQCGIAKTAKKWPQCIKYINGFAKAHGVKQWSSFLLARNVKTQMHKDNHNAPGSTVRTVTFGDFQGGELWVADNGNQFMEDKSQVHWKRDRNGVRRPGILVDTREKPYDLDPKTEHATQPWKGERWCLSFYISRGAEHIDGKDHEHLKQLGFPYDRAIAARTFGVNVTAHDLPHNREPHRESEGHGKAMKPTPQQSHFSDSVQCNPPASERLDGVTPCSEAQERVCQRHRSQDQGDRDRLDGARSQSLEGDMGGREAEEASLSSAHELEEERLGRLEGDLQQHRSPRHGVSRRQTLEQVGQGEAHTGDLDMGGTGQGVDRPLVGLQRLVRGVSAVRKLWNSAYDSLQPPDPRRILRMPEVSPVPNDTSSQLQWPPDGKSPEGVDCQERGGSQDEGEGEGERRWSFPTSRADSQGGREADGDPRPLRTGHG